MAEKRDRKSRDARAAVRRHREGRLAQRDDVQFVDVERPHICVPRELLVHRDDLPLVNSDLAGIGATELEVRSSLSERVARFQVPDRLHLGDAVARLRSRGGDRAARVSPHHVFAGLPNVHGGPADFATASDERIEFGVGARAGAGSGVRVALLDTGFTPNLHPWLDQHTEADAGSLEELDVHPRDGWLDDESGHGTFIAGVILARAPSATIEIAKVLDSEGYGSELEVAHAIIAHSDADVINLSLGCYSHDDLPPLALAEALHRVAPTTAVVAAAGNDATHRPLWPAAHKRVIAVGAVDETFQRAAFSNFGWWVDAAARGVDVLSAFLEFDEVGHGKSIPGRDPQNFRGWARWSGTSFAAPKLTGEVVAAMGRGGKSAREAAADLLAAGDRSRSPDLGVVFAF